jgi:dipeptidyl aminopeptidase/acylaminoacyl peptidase
MRSATTLSSVKISDLRRKVLMRSKRIVAFFSLLAALAAPGLGAQTAVIRPGDHLVAEGIPAIPASLAEEVRRYTESRGASFADWHPKAREILITTRFGNTPQVHRVAMPGGARTQITFFSEPVSGASYEPQQGRYFVFAKDVGGNEFDQLYRYDIADGRVTMLTDGGRSQNGGIAWSTKGDRMAYGSTRRNGADRDVYVMNPADPTGDRRVMQVTGGGWFTADWSPDDTKLLVLEYVSVSKSTLWIVDAATGAKTALTDPDGNVSYSGAEFSTDGRGVYVTTDRDSEFQRLGYLDLATRAFTPLTTDLKWDVENFDLSADGRTIAFSINEAGVSRLFLLDTDSRRSRPVAAAPAGVVGALAWHPNNRDLAFSVNNARSTSDVYSLDATNGTVSRWTEGELGGLVASDLSEPELIRWKSFDGLEITGFYYRPPARFTGKRPVIVNIHGGPEGQSRPTFAGRNNYFLNELGISLIFPNVRGSTGYGKTFVSLDNGVKREDSVKDIGALLDWIATRHELDASRVMVTGGSYGGYMTLAVSTHYSSRIRAAVDVVGISNFNTFLKNTESYRRDLRRVEYGDERDPAFTAFFEKIAPINNARQIRHPLFIVQGGNDPRVPRSEAEQMVERVKQNGTPVWYLMAKDEGHGFAKKQNADFQFYATVLFVREHVLGQAGEPAAPTK